MDRLDDRVRRGGQEAADLVRPRYRLRLGASIPVVSRPDAREGSERSFVVQREPDHVLLGLGIRLWCVFGEAGERY